MKEVAEYYGFPVSKRTNKICCPFHNDARPSMQIYSGDGGFYCFVCGVGGDVIDFVQQLYGLSFMDACKKLDQDFHLRLGIGDERTREEKLAAERAFRERMDKQQRRERERQFLYALYDAAYNRYSFLDILMMENKPTDPDSPVSQEYIYACKRIAEAWDDVQNAADRIRAFEEKTTTTKVGTMEETEWYKP